MLVKQKIVHVLKIDIEGVETDVILDIKDQLIKIENFLLIFI